MAVDCPCVQSIFHGKGMNKENMIESLICINSLDELVHDGQNGLVFESSQDLAEQWMELFVKNPEKLTILRTQVMEEFKNNTWQTQYKDVLVNLFNQKS